MQHLQKIGGGARLPRPQILQSSNVPLSDSLIHLFSFLYLTHSSLPRDFLSSFGINSLRTLSVSEGVAPFRHTRLPRGDSFSVSVNSVLSATSVLIPAVSSLLTAHYSLPSLLS